MRAVLFDLDGTLLAMDQDVFTKAYFGALAEKLSGAYDPEKLIKTVWRGIGAMLKNDGSATNEQVFWRAFADVFGERAYDDIPLFDEFYKTDFNELKSLCGRNERAVRTVKQLRRDGYKLVLASNPLFPSVAQKARMRWAGVDPDDFDYITSYENSHFCKPQAGYYAEIVQAIDCAAADCIMVGNDVGDDMPARDVGLKVFLTVNDYLINKTDKSVDEFPHGDFDDLLRALAVVS